MKKILIDKNACIGCGSCSIIASKTFVLGDDGKAKVIDPSLDTDQVIKEAVESCPTGAITVT